MSEGNESSFTPYTPEHEAQPENYDAIPDTSYNPENQSFHGATETSTPLPPFLTQPDHGINEPNVPSLIPPDPEAGIAHLEEAIKKLGRSPILTTQKKQNIFVKFFHAIIGWLISKPAPKSPTETP